jgi:hypothetical protein
MITNSKNVEPVDPEIIREVLVGRDKIDSIPKCSAMIARTLLITKPSSSADVRRFNVQLVMLCPHSFGLPIFERSNPPRIVTMFENLESVATKALNAFCS